MKLNPFKFFLLLILVPLTSCDWLNTDEVELSSNPNFVSLRFAANDSIPNLEDAVFTLEWDAALNDSIIVNLDSLPYNTRIDSVNPTFSFSSTSMAYLYLRDKLGVGIDTIAITGTDTIDFSRVISVKNIAEDGIAEKPYKIKVNVHKVEGELYQWNKISSGDEIKALANQKAILFKDSVFLYFMGSSVNNYLYSSIDGKDWTQKAVNNLPLGCNLRNIQIFKNKLYLINKEPDINSVSSEIYTSTDGANWTKSDFSAKPYSFVNFLFEFDTKLFAITKSKSGSIFSIRAFDGINWNDNSIKELPTDFPIEGFAAVSFTSKSMKQKALVVGGYSASGELLNNVWSTENGTLWLDFSTENTTLGINSGASIISYDNKLLFFGGMNEDRNIIDHFYMQSVDEGFSWSVPDTSFNVLKDVAFKMSYEPRSYQSVIVKSKTIYLFGGSDKSKVYNDVWTGRLNRLSFIRQ